MLYTQLIAHIHSYRLRKKPTTAMEKYAVAYERWQSLSQMSIYDACSQVAHSVDLIEALSIMADTNSVELQEVGYAY